MSRALILGGAALACSACVVGPEPRAPELSVPASFQTQVELGEDVQDGDWWRGFNDDALNALVDEALARNLTLEAARADVRTAQALVRASRSDLFPTLDLFADGQAAASFLDGVDADADIAAGGAFAFDADIAGRNKRSLQAARAASDAAAFSAEDVKRLVAQSVGLQYVELRRAGARLMLLESSLALQERTLEIVDARFRAGLSPELDVDRAASDLARTRAQRGRLVADRHDAIYALAVLTAQTPDAALLDEAGEDVIPRYAGGPGIGVPQDALRRRPDLRTAEAVLVAELALVGVETADLYPSLRLPGRVAARAATSGAVSEDITASLSSLVDIPLLDAGRRRAEVEAQQARADAAIAGYKNTRLQVLQEVEIALVRIAALQSQLKDLNVAVARSQSAYRQLEALYSEGLAGFIDVLDAQRNLISSREAVVDTEADIAAAIISLYASLGLGAQDLPASG